MTVDLQSLHGDWRYPTAIHFGPGRIAELPEVCRSAGITKPLLVTDPGLVNLSMVGEAVLFIEGAGVPVGVFADVQSNPVERNVADGLAAYRAGGHDGVIALGGGSVMDTGKIIAMMAGQEGALWDYEEDWGQISLDTIAPVVAVPTTAGTGSEVGRAAVITHQATQVKKIILHPGMMPRAVVADPALTLGLPPNLTAATGMDALAHSLEAFCAPFHHPMADGIALEGMRLVQAWLPEAVRNGKNLSARAPMMAAATMGAVAFQKGLGAIHALSHPVGAIYNTHHGLTNAVFMPYVLAFNRPAIEEKMERLARYLGLPDPGFDAVLRWILDLRLALDIPHTLCDLGVPADRLDDLAAMAAADPCAPENPVPVGEAELRQLYEDALEGRLASGER